jgi:hypothetical protein
MPSPQKRRLSPKRLRNISKSLKEYAKKHKAYLDHVNWIKKEKEKGRSSRTRDSEFNPRPPLLLPKRRKTSGSFSPFSRRRRR